MFQRLLIPLDGSAYAERALSYGADLAKLTGAEIVLLSVIEVSGEPEAAGEATSDPAHEPIADRYLDYLDEQAGQLRDAGVHHVSTQVLAGEPAQAIVRAARTLPADLIIMSTEGLGAKGEFALGSVAISALRTAHCPIFMVRIDRPDPPRDEAEQRWQAEGGANVA